MNRVEIKKNLLYRSLARECHKIKVSHDKNLSPATRPSPAFHAASKCFHCSTRSAGLRSGPIYSVAPKCCRANIAANGYRLFACFAGNKIYVSCVFVGIARARVREACVSFLQNRVGPQSKQG